MDSVHYNITNDNFSNGTIEYLDTTTTSSIIIPPFLTWDRIMIVTILAVIVCMLLTPVISIITSECCGISLCNICLKICVVIAFTVEMAKPALIDVRVSVTAIIIIFLSAL